MNKYALRNNWHAFWTILHSHNRCNELNRLIQWAQNRKFDGPKNLYKSRHAHEENRLMQYKWRHPRLSRFAYAVYLFGQLISSKPKYYTSGSASIYRYDRSMKR